MEKRRENIFNEIPEEKIDIEQLSNADAPKLMDYMIKHRLLKPGETPERGWYAVSKKDSKIIGYIMTRPIKELIDEATGQTLSDIFVIKYVQVAPGDQVKGVGKKMVDFVENIYKEPESHVQKLYVQSVNHEWWEKLGYKPIAENSAILCKVLER